jgi:Ni/Fe-hydrogenase subunit HybB-like protein
MHHDDFQKHEGRLFTRSFFALLALVLMGGYLVTVRFIHGIGAVSGMSDGFPWGIWITYDVATGTAIACGGYAVAILVYIRHHMHYHPMIRACILTSMFGYGLAGISVIIDCGRPWNVYNFFIPSQWQVNSVLFEVAVCVMAYTVVLIIEFLPALLYSLEKSEWLRFRAFVDCLHPSIAPKKETLINHIQKARRIAGSIRPMLDKVLIFFIVLGITLPTMHQSALGSMLLIASTKLNPLWHTGFLPLLFLINCIYIGYSMAIMESIISSYAFKRPFEVKELSGLAGIIPWLTAIWMTVVLGDLAWRGQIAAALRFDFYSCFFLLEFALIAFGSAILFNKRNRLSPQALFVSAVLIVLGGALYRFNVYLIGYNPGPGWTYFPSLAELGITVSIVAFEILGYQVLVKLVPVLPKLHLHGHGKPAEKHSGQRPHEITAEQPNT